MLWLLVVHLDGEEDIDGADDIVVLRQHGALALKMEWGALHWLPKALRFPRRCQAPGAHCDASSPDNCGRESFKRTLMAKRTLTVPMTLLCCVKTARERSIME